MAAFGLRPEGDSTFGGAVFLRNHRAIAVRKAAGAGGRVGTNVRVAFRSVAEILSLLGIALLFKGHHRFELEDTPNGTRLTHSEEFSGLAAPLILRKSVVAQIEEGFQMMNNALKTRAESYVANT